LRKFLSQALFFIDISRIFSSLSMIFTARLIGNDMENILIGLSLSGWCPHMTGYMTSFKYQAGARI